ncbi:MAG: hypothetical protein P1U39_02345 [Legionellaceae bacterium]|nr:hypothetical protein [Legionellaceae bacterium]
MKYYPIVAVWMLLCIMLNTAYAQSTARTAEFSNHKTNVWKTVIYPKSNQVLSMHRHRYDRVLIALTNGTLKITNNQGEVHYLKLKKNKAYYLKKDPMDELHQDENITKHPITVMVIELKK